MLDFLKDKSNVLLVCFFLPFDLILINTRGALHRSVFMSHNSVDKLSALNTLRSVSQKNLQVSSSVLKTAFYIRACNILYHAYRSSEPH